jgi:hypothetical protein
MNFCFLSSSPLGISDAERWKNIDILQPDRERNYLFKILAGCKKNITFYDMIGTENNIKSISTKMDIVHFVGHGSRSDDCLLLEEEMSARGVYVTGDRFARLFQSGLPQLAVISACHSGYVVPALIDHNFQVLLCSNLISRHRYKHE